MPQLRHLHFFHHECPGRTKRLIIHHILRDNLAISCHLQLRTVKAQIREGIYSQTTISQKQEHRFPDDNFLFTVSAFLKCMNVQRVTCVHRHMCACTHVHIHVYACICWGESNKFRKQSVQYYPLEYSVMKSIRILLTHLWIIQNCVYSLNTFTELRLCFRMGKVRT